MHISNQQQRWHTITYRPWIRWITEGKNGYLLHIYTSHQLLPFSVFPELPVALSLISSLSGIGKLQNSWNLTQLKRSQIYMRHYKIVSHFPLKTKQQFLASINIQVQCYTKSAAPVALRKFSAEATVIFFPLGEKFQIQLISPGDTQGRPA